MIRVGSVFFLTMLAITGCAQHNNNHQHDPVPVHSLLWKIEGNGLQKPSWLYGTIHMLCKDDAVLSDSMKNVISSSDQVYFELDMDNLFEMLGAMSKLKMRDDTTLRDLLTETEYERVKKYFEENNSMLPFSVLETYKPIMASSLLSQGEMPCEGATSMEQVIMSEAKENGKKIKGLETMSQQAGFLDSIPYKYQAAELVKYIDSSGTGNGEDKMMTELMDAYRKQDLEKLESLMVDSEAGMSSYADILLYRRNANWVEQLKTLMKEKSLLIAVGAGHLPGEKGVISLLKKAGYKVTPVENKRSSRRTI